MNTDVVIVEPSGRLDALGALDLWAELEPLTSHPPARVIVDLSQTRYASSDGLRALLRGMKAAQKNGGGLKLCGLNARLIEIVTMAGLDEVFEIYPTRAAAQRAFES